MVYANGLKVIIKQGEKWSVPLRRHIGEKGIILQYLGEVPEFRDVTNRDIENWPDERLYLVKLTKTGEQKGFPESWLKPLDK